MASTTDDTVSLQLRFENGSIGTIHYLSNGNRSFPKEKLEVFTDGTVITLDNFRKLRAYGFKNFKSMNLWRQDKGQRHCVSKFLFSIDEGLKSPIPSDELFEVAKVSIELSK